MCTYLQTINDVIDEQINNKWEFSAHDITKEVRKRSGTGVFIDHQTVRAEVASRFDNGGMSGYQRNPGSRHSLFGTAHPLIYSPDPPVPVVSDSQPSPVTDRTTVVQDSLKVTSFWDKSKDLVNKLFSTGF